ncbi:MAG TPA: YkgJ family cysteine cluster protein [Terracidiphilus sp.]|jgi:Fe-S-cluster containining protein|nr:YkgJ family cysteine cluster protein [Terracidiphilus sp.]
MSLPAGDSALIQIVDASLAEAAQRAGPWLVCKPGCTQCCYGAFAIDALDAERLRTGMRTLQADDPAAAEAMRERARGWLARYGPGFPGDAETGVLGTGEADRERFETYADEAACPALDPATGLCGVYAWRPMTCRVFGPPVRMAGAGEDEGLGHCELCFQGATAEQVAACEMTVPQEMEARLVEEIGSAEETIVAFALLR